VRWLVASPQGNITRDTTTLQIEKGGNSRVKPKDMAMFRYDDIISEVEIEVVSGTLKVDQIKLLALLN
jgi:hypothetical protein